MSAYSTAELAIYAILILPILFILCKHGRPGILGWLYLTIFCSLRIIGGGLSLSSKESASIVGNIGLSPLLLGTCGILHESTHYSSQVPNRKLWIIFVLAYHMVVAAATGLVAAGASALQSEDSTPDDLTQLKAGIAILTAAWVILLVLSVAVFAHERKLRTNDVLERTRNYLQVGVLFALIFIGVRVIYTLVAFVTQDQHISPTTGNLAIRVILSLLMELIAVLIYIFAGVSTRNARAEAIAMLEISQHSKEQPYHGRTAPVVQV